MNENESINSLISKQVVLDEDISLGKTISLLGLNNEEERLDFKEGFDTTNQQLFQRNKIDLICDIVSMSNTDGGYIILGIKEDSVKFFVSGVSVDLIDKLSPENLNTLLKNYVDPVPKVLTTSHEIDGKLVIVIYVGKSKILLPFKVDGQYHLNGKSNTKFYNGEIYVRHSAKSEKALYHDIIQFVEEIREDERKKGSPHNDSSSLGLKLDKIIELMGGTSKKSFDINIYTLNDIEIEDYFYDLFGDAKSKRYFDRIIAKIFTSFRKELFGTGSIKDKALKQEKLNRITSEFFPKLIPIYYACIQSENKSSAIFLNEKLYNLYKEALNNWDDQKFDFFDILYVITELIKTVYIVGALFIKIYRRDLAENIIRRKGDIIFQEHGEAFWFRFILTQNARYHRLQVPSLIHGVFESYKDNVYVVELFETEENLKRYLSQFDYYQCLITILDGQQEMNCYPSYKIYEKKYIEEFLENYIHDGWTDEYKQKIADSIRILENYVSKHSSGYVWWNSSWHSTAIKEFLAKYSPKN